MELRGHEHVVEVAIFAPVASYPAIRELGGIKVSTNDLLITPRTKKGDEKARIGSN